MREKFMRFMQGRNGVDPFGRFTMGVALVSIILGIFLRDGNVLKAMLDTIGFMAIIYTYFRMFSRNIQKRYQENCKYLEIKNKVLFRFRKEKNMMEQRKTHHIYTCPGCGQKIRIPKGKGKIEIDCPKCHTKFVKKS